VLLCTAIYSDTINLSALKSGESAETANMHFIQATFSGDFVVTFTYTSSGAASLDGKLRTGPPDECLRCTNDSVKAHAVEQGISGLHSTFASDVDKAFPRTSPFVDEKYGNLSQALLSNLLGGLGFFHGDSRVDASHAPEYEETGLNFWEKAAAVMAKAPIVNTAPTSLLTLTPSRPFFPRGFLWDEGFHLLPVIEWDLDLAVAVLRSWLGLMDADGWIAREQILGPEARSKVPDQFQVQYPHYANPPTLSLLFPILISKLARKSAYNGRSSAYMSSPAEAAAMLRELYQLLARHYRWFRRTQAGDFGKSYPRPEGAVPGEGYRWRGRTPRHTLTSGLDDYPRADPPHPAELHVDALAWVGASAHHLQQVAEYLGEEADAAMYKTHLENVKKNLDILHWSAQDEAYCDATIKDTKFQLVCNKGYVSLFPLLLGLLHPQHPNLLAVLDLLSDPAQLWSPHGLRSLSLADANYGKGENYWRGAVWMNLNVLAVLRLRDLGMEEEGPTASGAQVQNRALSLASELSKRVVDTVYDSWETTGFAWEQYSDTTGEGSHSRAFTGWTACVLLLLDLDFTRPVAPIEGHTTSSLVSMWVIIVALAIVVLVARFWRPLRILTIRMTTFRRRRQMRGARYEQVIDLDEHAPELNTERRRRLTD
jgi:mannosyl-oligosaccharide glucosidase